MDDIHDLITRTEKFLNSQEEVFGKLKFQKKYTIPDVTTHTVYHATGSEHPGVHTSSEEQKMTYTTDSNSSSTDSNGPTKATPITDQTARLDAVHDLASLETLCRAEPLLKTDLNNTNLVFGVGNPNADLMLIGEAPGEQEDKLGEPFVGKAGILLNKILLAIHFKREDIYIANILKHRPPANRDPLPEERQRSLPYLLKQIDLINPKLILCLGRIAAHTLLGVEDPMKVMRNRFHPFREKYELMVTFHPAALLRNPAWKRDTWEDVQLLRKRYDELGCKP